jgi:hypothetical protein
MNDLRAHTGYGPHELSTTTNNNNKRLVAFQFFCLEIRKIFVQLFCLKAGRETLPNNVVLFIIIIIM